ncbi:ABC-F family ATP-binding cassette domain-containing protein [Actinoplanes sp. NBRC 103695]|uniref:ABC-F family ATP-binding cassette domain-containing protein n=1 Tax=Actinoplanes sp. NBRC 103695 TaxID=3032202 RepID=UPI0024A12B5D|nr:ABC-F family ATP-binding cassette domain-containing protein [Actinoplanes sp. NBRC 103695]GLY95098.1 ABC transporter ATP-binding protein [Actinoplanes sp. NBRC 103695]
MLKAVSLGCAHDGDLLFSGFDLVLGDGDRVGVVGPNGAGKSTLLRALAGQIKPASGVVTHGPGLSVAFVPQQVPDPEGTAGAFLAEGLGEAGVVAARVRAGDADEALLERYVALEAWGAETRIEKVRQRLGLAGIEDGRLLREVSGGEQARLLLARALLAEPDVLLLDEPTNHLDAEGAAWLQSWLADFPGAVLAVSHDRAFLDSVVSRIVELDGIHEEPQGFPGGGYTPYRVEKERRWRRWLLDFEAQEKDRLRWEQDIELTKRQALGVELTVRSGAEAPHLRRVARKVARKAKVRERRLRRQMESLRWVDEPRRRPPLTLAFPEDDGAPGDEVLPGVKRGDRVWITGRNGSGKTTLLRELASERTATLPQTADGLPREQTLMEFFRSQVPVYVDDAERLLLGHQFDEDMWDSPLGTLSAGELRRLLLAVMVNRPERVLLLDEPTNFLDFDALEVLEEALRRYRGTLLVVSHDRYFAEAVGLSRVWHVEGPEKIAG